MRSETLCNTFPGDGDAEADGLGTSLRGPLVWAPAGKDGAVEGFHSWYLGGERPCLLER